VNEVDKSLGTVIYQDIDSNEYLEELFETILQNYSLSLFHIKNRKPQSFNISHAQRFADLLSKSVDSQKSELHKVWAQEIVALLYNLYPEDPNVKYCLGSVLTNICNYRGLNLQPEVYRSADIFEQVYSNFEKDILKIPSDPQNYFFKSQKAVYDSLNYQYFSYSGPTSMGKSFVMRMFIKEQLIKGFCKNFAIVVPTKALINEVSSRIIDDFQDLLSKHDYRVVTSAGALSLQQQHNFVLILTPERLLYLLLDKPNFGIDYLFIDEAHKISSKDSRSPFYYKIIDILSKREYKAHVIFSSPNIPNPEIYLQLVPQLPQNEAQKLATTFTPVSQIKYIVDLVEGQVQLFNDYNHHFLEIGKFHETVTLTQLIHSIGKDCQNIIYCSSTNQAVNYALEYSQKLPSVDDCPELLALSRDIRNEIHSDYYLAEVLTKGVAYHIGYLPADIRMRIEVLFKHGHIKAIFCTSTLVEGVNLPADNLFITNYKNGRSDMTPVDFRNLIGRVGRIEFNLYGNVFLVRTNEKTSQGKYIELLQKEVPQQKLSIASELTRPQKLKIIESLLSGNIELLKYPKNQSADSYSLMRKFAIILLRDIMTGNTKSVVKKEFASVLSTQQEQTIFSQFKNKGQTDDDINISLDQMGNLTSAVAKGVKYPEFNESGNIDYDELVTFLKKLCTIFKWDVYESSTLGHRSKKTGNHGKLRWYAVILVQWIQGNGLSLIMKDAIEYKRNHPESAVEETDGTFVNYDDSTKHRNIVISDTLNAIENVILFRISNYFLRFSAEYKKFHKLAVIQNDWYEYVEYGTTNPLTIMLQRNGLSRETSTYIKKHREYLLEINGAYKIRSSILTCENTAVQKEATEIKYNIPELFVE
jgi:superfamily II DNA or RNA helicase